MPLFFSRLLRGELSFPLTFWGFLIGGWIAIVVVVEILVLTVFWNLPLLRGLSLLGAEFVYPLVVSVGVWRSANRSLAASRYKIAAKTVVLTIIAGFIWWILSGGPETLFFRVLGA